MAWTPKVRPGRSDGRAAERRGEPLSSFRPFPRLTFVLMLSRIVWALVALAGAAGVGRPGPPPRRNHQRRLARPRRRRHLPRRLPLLQPLPRRPGLRASTTAGPRPPSGSPTAATSCRRRGGCCSATTSPPSPAPGRWSGRCSPRSSASCPAPSGSSSAWCSAGAVQDFVILVRLDAARRQVARPDGEGGDRPGRRHPRDGRGPRDHGDPARRAGARRGERAQGQPVGRLHHPLHHPDRAC